MAEEAIIDSAEKSFVEANMWADEERPSSEILLQLAQDKTPESYEALREFADKYDIEYSDDTSPQELYDRISLRMDQEADNEKLS
jgi:hypothetical protein